MPIEFTPIYIYIYTYRMLWKWHKLTFAHESGHLVTLIGIYNLQSNSCTNGSTTATKSIQPFFQSEMLGFEHVFKSRFPSPAINSLPRFSPNRILLPECLSPPGRSWREEIREACRGPWPSVISLKGGERAIKGEAERQGREEKLELETYSIH